ncbi:hypothetical protein E6C27_scaffold243G005960 [Cucumis melo var. makuwa]|uniref:Uncharacterized protein n=1 Tax=Cucumis melo var. makuwa TaxID=1194695 RepID=A0A5A7TVW1_CUCMM|nr:hypothetical protein E6C27_scaffold243G005960 [Cucumis melo var. makuwa]
MRLSIHNEGGRGWGVKSCRCLFPVDFGSLTLMPHGMMLDEVGGISWVVLTPTNLSFWLDARKCEKMWVKWHIEVLETFATIRDLFVLSGHYGSKSFLTILVESYYVNLINVVNFDHCLAQVTLFVGVRMKFLFLDLLLLQCG